LYVENIAGYPDDNTTDYFDNFFKTTGLWRPHFHSVTSSGPFGAVSTAIKHSGTTVIDLFESYAPVLTNCYLWGGAHACKYIVTSDPGGEGGYWHDTIFDGNVGLLLQTTGSEPGFDILKCHFNCADTGLEVNGKKLGTVAQCLFYNEGTTAYSDIDLIKSQDVTIRDNTFHFGGNALRKMVHLSGGANVVRTYIEGNKFRADGTAIHVTASADEVFIKDSYFNTDVDTEIVDLGATNIHVRHIKRRGCRVALTANESIADVTISAILWDTAINDTDSFYPGGSDSRIIIPSNKGIKKVILKLSVLWTTNADGIREIYFSIGGTDFVGNVSDYKNAVGGSGAVIITPIIDVSDGDVIRAITYQNSGAATNILFNNKTWFELEVVE